MSQKEACSFQRGSGILLSITSLPSPYGIGTLGKAAYEFVDFLRRSQQRYWQVLPIGPTSFGDSPYQSFSAFAGNPYFIDLDTLAEEGLLQYDEINCHDWGYDATRVDYARIFESRFTVLRKAFDRSNHRTLPEFRKFCEENVFWLNDYSLYMALKFYFDNREWQLWENDIRLRKPGAIKLYTDKLANDIEFWKFLQFKFFEQWNRLKAYARTAPTHGCTAISSSWMRKRSLSRSRAFRRIISRLTVSSGATPSMTGTRWKRTASPGGSSVCAPRRRFTM